jgi:hypothetical protein
VSMTPACVIERTIVARFARADAQGKPKTCGTTAQKRISLPGTRQLIARLADEDVHSIVLCLLVTLQHSIIHQTQASAQFNRASEGLIFGVRRALTSR